MRRIYNGWRQHTRACWMPALPLAQRDGPVTSEVDPGVSKTDELKHLIGLQTFLYLWSNSLWLENHALKTAQEALDEHGCLSNNFTIPYQAWFDACNVGGILTEVGIYVPQEPQEDPYGVYVSRWNTLQRAGTLAMRKLKDVDAIINTLHVAMDRLQG
jgi:hypothetical protein